MKIAIVSFYLMETTIPLAKHLSTSGVDIDLYNVLPYNNQNTYVFDFLANKQPIGFVEEKVMKKNLGKKLCNYLLHVNTKIFICLDSRFQRLFLIDFYYAFKLANHIKKGIFDLIHIIYISRIFWSFVFLFLEKSKLV